MRIAYITAGAAGTICGNCLQDNALAAAIKRMGHDVVLLPAYTPLLTDEDDVSEERVVFSGINLYLQERFGFFRSSGAMDRALDSPRLLRWASSFAVDTDPANLGVMTRDMFQGADGPFRREMDKLVGVLRDIRPAVVHLTNSMLAAMAVPIQKALGVPVVCSIQGEADFLAKLPQPYRDECIALLAGYAARIDRLVAPCEDQKDAMAPMLGDLRQPIATIRPGISLEGFGERREAADDRFVIGFLARIAEEKGLELLAAAVERLRSRHPERTIELRVAGWRAAGQGGYVRKLTDTYGFKDLGYLTRPEKCAFLAGIDAFSVPAVYRASKGLYVLEALAAGVPVVQPRIGAFPELLEATGGGLACAPNDSDDLASKLEEIMTAPDEARKLADEGRRRVRANFSADRMASEALALYAELAG